MYRYIVIYPKAPQYVRYFLDLENKILRAGNLCSTTLFIIMPCFTHLRENSVSAIWILDLVKLLFP